MEKAALSRIVEALDQNIPARAVQLTEDESVLVKGLQLLTMKPMIYAANVNEADLADQGYSNAYVQALREKAAKESCDVIIVSAQVWLCGSTQQPSASSLLQDTIRLGRTPCRTTWTKSDDLQINDLFCDAQVEAELRELDPVEAAEYLESLGASEGGLASLIRTAYRQLGLLTYFTTGGPSLS